MISLVRNDPMFRLQRRVGLIPAEGLGLGRRVVFWSLLTWLPIIAWGVATGRIPGPGNEESILAHFGVHTRMLIAVPLFILAEGMAHRITMELVPELLRTGIIPKSETDKFRALLARVAATRDSVLPWLLVLAFAAALSSVSVTASRAHELDWAMQSDGGGYGFGALWFLYFAKPVYFFFMLAWLWRVVLLFKVFHGIAALNLELVPTHPDRMAGLSCLDRISVAFSLVIFGLSASLCSGWAHDAIYHGLEVQTLAPHIAVFLVAILLIFLSPLLAFSGRLIALKRKALLDYAALIGNHDRLVDRRWIQNQAIVEDGNILDAPELGPVADIHQLFHAVKSMRPVPATVRTVVAILVPAAIPIMAVLSIQIPLKNILLALLKAIA